MNNKEKQMMVSEIRQLRRKNRMLEKTLLENKREQEVLTKRLDVCYVLIDRLQSFIPMHRFWWDDFQKITASDN